MNIVDQNKALIALEYALENHSQLIDSRSEIDNLNFLVNFSSLINFYDDKNEINGDWRPFLLKDPEFLLASIAKTPFKHMYSLFLQTCATLDQALHSENIAELTDKISTCFKQLFYQLLQVFHLLERWIYFMLQCPMVYNLKSYIIKNVKEHYSQYLWAILWTKQQLHHSKQVVDIENVNMYFYEFYDEKIWKQGKEKRPFTLLGLQYPITDNSLEIIFKGLKDVGEKIFTFLNSIVEYAPLEFKAVATKEDIYPDTLLLKTFTKLMHVYKRQVNGLTKKHLDFYYKQILKEHRTPAKADEVFVALTLADETAVFELPKATQFNAGTYEDETPIVFESIDKTSLNPVTISDAYTLTKTKTANVEKLYLVHQKDVTSIQENEQGQIQSWKTFGSDIVSKDNQVGLGFVLASPMLYLTEGKRHIYLKYTFEEEIKDLTFFENGVYSLSGEEEWFTIPSDTISFSYGDEGNLQLIIAIELSLADPAIVAFTESPEGLATTWPIFRMYFSEFTNLASPFVIKEVTIDVSVTNFQNFQLYSDFGLLETEKPFQPLGPTPERNQNFMIGSSEIFSKPVTDFSFRMDWDNLPELGFVIYYEQYNKYAMGFYQTPPVNEGDSFLLRIWKGIGNLFSNEAKKLEKALKNVERTIKKWDDKEEKKVESLLEDLNQILKKILPKQENKRVLILQTIEKVVNTWLLSEEESTIEELIQEIENIITTLILEGIIYRVPFNDKAFKVDFQILQNKQWLPVKMDTDTSIFDEICKVTNEVTELTLFQGVPDVGEADISTFLSINASVSIEVLLAIKDIFKATVSFETITGLIFKDTFTTKGLLSVDNRLDVGAFFKLKDKLSFAYVLENQDSIRFIDVIDLKLNLKAKDVFTVHSSVTVKNTLQIESHLQRSGISIKETTLEELDFQLNKILIINTSLSFYDVIEINKNISLEEVLNGTKQELFKLKKGVSIADFFEDNLTTFPLHFSSSFAFENILNEKQTIRTSGTIFIDETIQISNILNIINKGSFNKVFTADCSFIENQDQHTFEELLNYSVFETTALSAVQSTIDPTIQNSLLEFSDTTATGFMRMQLIAPEEGFGATMYPKVVSAIALYNADLIAKAFNGEEVKLEQEANEPYTPIVGLFKGNYSSTVTYTFSKKDTYPVTCFYQDVFKTYKVYDSTFDEEKNKEISNGFPGILPKYKYKGALFLGLEQLIAPSEVGFYFELAQDAATAENTIPDVSYEYLTKYSWKELPVFSDTTNGFNCSGILTTNIPSDISDVHRSMPNEKYWIEVGVSNNPDSYCPTLFLTTNGVKLKRTGTEFKTNSEKPEIPANSIETTEEAVPQIATVVQPFASFNGKSLETQSAFYKRVSVRLKTKDRVVTYQDFYRVIKAQFPEIYYTKQVYDKPSKTTNVYLVQEVGKSKDANAFTPFVNGCIKDKVQHYLEKKASQFANVLVSNCTLRYLKIKGTVTVTKGKLPEGVANKVNVGINVFLSPWIKTVQEQITIDSGVSAAQISEFITSYKSVTGISKLYLYLGTKNISTGVIAYESTPYQIITSKDLKSSDVLVPSLDYSELSYSV